MQKTLLYLCLATFGLTGCLYYPDHVGGFEFESGVNPFKNVRVDVEGMDTNQIYLSIFIDQGRPPKLRIIEATLLDKNGKVIPSHLDNQSRLANGFVLDFQDTRLPRKVLLSPNIEARSSNINNQNLGFPLSNPFFLKLKVTSDDRVLNFEGKFVYRGHYEWVNLQDELDHG